jgi:hypothetical protein
VAGLTRSENVDLLARRVDRLSDGERTRLQAVEGCVADRARSLPPELFARFLGRELRRVKDPTPGATIAERQAAESTFTMDRQPCGQWDLHGRLDDERATQLHAVLTNHAALLAGDEPVTANHRAQALYHLITRTTGDAGGPGPKLGIGYIVDAQTLTRGPHGGSVTQTWGGADIDPTTIARLACDSDLYAVLVDQLGQPGPVGRTHRAATRNQRLQLRALYPVCPLDGTPFDRCEIHHVNQFYDNGGPTELPNLLPISRAWHHRIHDRGWTLKMADNRSLELRRPDGTLERAIPPPTPITRE